jgi:hypothetical protein
VFGGVYANDQVLLQLGLVGERLLEREQRRLEGPLQRRQLEALGADPAQWR